LRFVATDIDQNATELSAALQTRGRDARLLDNSAAILDRRNKGVRIPRAPFQVALGDDATCRRSSRVEQGFDVAQNPSDWSPK